MHSISCVVVVLFVAVEAVVKNDGTPFAQL